MSEANPPYTPQTVQYRTSTQNAEHAVFCADFEVTDLGRLPLFATAEKLADVLNRAYKDGYAAGQLDVASRVNKALLA